MKTKLTILARTLNGDYYTVNTLYFDDWDDAKEYVQYNACYGYAYEFDIA